MIKLYLTSLLSVMCISLNAQNVVGTYVDLTQSDKEIDSLILLSDSTYRYAFYYPKYAVSEYYTGKWNYVNGEIILENAGLSKPAFILTPLINQEKVIQLQMREAKLRKKKKGQVLKRSE